MTCRRSRFGLVLLPLLSGDVKRPEIVEERAAVVAPAKQIHLLVKQAERGAVACRRMRTVDAVVQLCPRHHALLADRRRPQIAQRRPLAVARQRLTAKHIDGVLRRNGCVATARTARLAAQRTGRRCHGNRRRIVAGGRLARVAAEPRHAVFVDVDACHTKAVVAQHQTPLAIARLRQRRTSERVEWRERTRHGVLRPLTAFQVERVQEHWRAAVLVLVRVARCVLIVVVVIIIIVVVIVAIFAVAFRLVFRRFAFGFRMSRTTTHTMFLFLFQRQRHKQIIACQHTSADISRCRRVRGQ
mmetsp:Transcript_17227/g.29936  ORF Transcript_17227/g.29936 Transcript_17227/m.29936 type:complete len:300 (+) Transcript_17227:1680-2579(+)